MLSSATGLGVKETMKAEMIEVHVRANTEEHGMQESKLNKKADQRRVRRRYPLASIRLLAYMYHFPDSFRFSLHFVSVFISYQLSLHVRLHAERYRACQIT